MPFFFLPFIVLLTTGLIAGIVFNNVWRFMPEFHVLDNIFSAPLYLQIILLLICIFTGVAFYRKKGNKGFGTLFVIAIILSISSWYQVILSNNTNSFTAELYPFYQREVKFDTIKTVKVQGHKLIVLTNSKKLTIYTGMYPCGLDQDLLWATILKHGNCLSKIDNNCTEIKFSSP